VACVLAVCVRVHPQPRASLAWLALAVLVAPRFATASINMPLLELVLAARERPRLPVVGMLLALVVFVALWLAFGCLSLLHLVPAPVAEAVLILATKPVALLLSAHVVVCVLPVCCVQPRLVVVA